MAEAGPGQSRPQSVLFMCGQNVIRSVMAEVLAKHYFGRSLYVASAGVKPGENDPFVAASLDEIGLSAGKHRPHTLDDLEDLNFDLIVTLAPEAHHAALDLTARYPVEVEYWPMMDPTLALGGSREQVMDAYRSLRDTLDDRIRDRFRFAGKARV
ncbi:low molecular weight phosphatase family protein [Chelatococcus sambhunathii]|uniref:Low molecular weight phosphatase family protein n=1 Tax=Chelatococcus sambhunathii TaxID=363953 RepID=A0ABU1DKG8_9HYPH|nr:low molecular weight phosphatase family protein [Chelatococcus sambhunathii]MDR4308618.1 low molecular weight phosphatase family protein [Chelatococcus sambhunathii]